MAGHETDKHEIWTTWNLAVLGLVPIFFGLAVLAYEDVRQPSNEPASPPVYLVPTPAQIETLSSAEQAELDQHNLPEHHSFSPVDLLPVTPVAVPSPPEK